jgi:flagellar biogenesis protein FliO
MDRIITYGIIALVLFLIWLLYVFTRNKNSGNQINDVIGEQYY